MSVRDEFQSVAANAAKEILELLGDTVSYTNRNASAVTLSAHPGAESTDLSFEMGHDAETIARPFLIPKQTNFPPANGVNIGDGITFDNKTYRVELWRDISGGYGALFRLECVRTRTATIGVMHQ